MKRLTLLLGALMYLAFGGVLAIDPGRLDVWVGVQGATPAALNEIRAFYGGGELGLGLFLLLCLMRPAWTQPGLVLLALFNACILAARIGGWIFEVESFDSTSATIGAFELGFVVLPLLAMRPPKKGR